MSCMQCGPCSAWQVAHSTTVTVMFSQHCDVSHDQSSVHTAFCLTEPYLPPHLCHTSEVSSDEQPL